MNKLPTIAGLILPIAFSGAVFGRLNSRGFFIPSFPAADASNKSPITGMGMNDKPANRGVFLGVTNRAKNFNITSFQGKSFINATGNDVMTMKMIGASAFLAFFNFLDSLYKKAIFSVGSSRYASFPIRMIGAGSFFAFSNISAFKRAVISSSSIAFSCVKNYVTLFANSFNKCFNFFMFTNIPASGRAKQSAACIANPAFKKMKFLITNFANSKDFSSSMFRHAI